MEDLKIEKNVPMKVTYDRGATALLQKMEVGDSVFIKDRPSGNVRQGFYNPSKRLGMRVSVKKVPGGCRVWRVQ